MTEEDKERTTERRSESFLRNILENLDQYAFGIITEHGYRELENRLNEHAAEIEKKFHKWIVQGLVAFALIALACTVALIGFGVLLDRQSEFLGTIKDTRKEFVRESCKAQNLRHDNTIVKLRNLSKAAPPRPDQAQRLRATIELIDALAPKQDCEELAAVAVGDAEPPPPSARTPTTP